MIRAISGSFRYLLLAIIISFPVFGHLDDLPIRQWDESRLAASAYEMHKNGNYLVPTFLGSPDMWSTKPPLMIWSQVMLMKIIGVNELSVRLPSAISAFLTCIALLFFSIRYLKDYWFGFIAVMVLITSNGYIHYHASRTGDYDAMLTLWTTLSCLLFFAYTEKKENHFLYFFFFALSMGVLTKGVAGILFTPALIIYYFARHRNLSILKNKHFWFSISLFLFLSLGYYLVREMINPGYFAAVRENELGGRYLNVLDAHQNSAFHYISLIKNLHFAEWFILIPCGYLVGFFSRNERLKRITLFCGLMVICYLILISCSQTKMDWYDVPLYPFLAILVAALLYQVFLFTRDSEWFKLNMRANILHFVFLALVFYVPYQFIFNKTYLPVETQPDKQLYSIAYKLKDAVKGDEDLNGYSIVFEGYNAHLFFYTRILQEKGVEVGFKEAGALVPGDKIIANQPEVIQSIRDHYFHTFLKEGEFVKMLRIDSIR